MIGNQDLAFTFQKILLWWVAKIDQESVTSTSTFFYLCDCIIEDLL